MPIYGLTDRGLEFAQIGVIRKGAPKDETKNRPGADLKYFRVEFDMAEQDSAKTFLEAYGPTPTRINVIFPFNDLDSIAQFWLEAYTAGRMVARSDGKIYLYKVDTKTGEVIVKDGVHLKTGQPELYDPAVPAGYYKTRDGKTEAIYCKGVGRIRVVVPELKRLAYLLLMTTSINDIANLSKQLQGIYEANGHRIAGIPLILQRKPRKVSTPDQSDKTKRVRREKWLLSLEPNPLWVEAKLLEMDKAAYLFGEPRQVAALPAKSIIPPVDNEWVDVPPSDDLGADDEDDEITGEFSEEVNEPDPVAVAEAVTFKNKRLGDSTTEDLKRLRASLETMRKEGKVLRPETVLAYDAAGLLIDYREGLNDDAARESLEYGEDK